MSKIILKKEGDAETAVFEKRGITHEFTLGEIDAFLNDLQKQRVSVEQQLIQLQTQMDRLSKPGVNINQKERFDFIMYINACNSLKLAQERIPELEKAHPTFKEKFSKIEKPEDASRWYQFAEEEKNLEAEVELIDKTKEDYLIDRKKALSCLETIQK